MKKYMICFGIICILFFSTSISATTLIISDDGDDELDQYNEIHDTVMVEPNSGEYHFAQSFTPTYNILTRVVVQKCSLNMALKSVKLTVRSDINGNDIVIPITVKPKDIWDVWLVFDLPDLQVVPGETYYLVWRTLGGGTNGFYCSEENPYPKGNAYGFNFWAPLNEWVSENSYDFCFKTYGRNGNDANNPPEIPVQLSTIDLGLIGEEQSFQYRAFDIDGDQVKIRVDWDDGTDPTESELVDSNELITFSHVWEEPNVYWMKITAIDEQGSESVYNLDSEPVYISSYENNPPMKPILWGDTEGAFNHDFEFSVTTWDCDKNDIYYMFDFGDETTSGWLGPYESGETCTTTKSWKGFLFTEYYDISVAAKDSNDAKAVSDSMEVKVYQGREKSVQSLFPRLFNFFDKLLQNI